MAILTHTQSAFLLLSLFITESLSARLYVSHYAGNVSALSLRGNALKEDLSRQACGPSPSWLTYDSPSRTIYCSDETYLSALGSLSAFKNDETSLLHDIKVEAPRGGVANVVYGGGDRYVAVAHYQVSQVSTFKLPLTSSSTTQQIFTYTMDKPGPNPARQDRPHPHQTLTDPTGSFLLAPDLGADITRVFAIDKASGKLTECPGLNSPPGAGPRHAAFWTSKTAHPHSPSPRAPSVTMLYVLNELSNKLIAYYVRYPSLGCLSFVQTQAISPYPNNQPAPAGASTAEIHIKDNFIYTSNRNDSSFAGNDSIATWSIAKNGTIEFQKLSSSYGSYPRTFSINRAGDRIAVGNQVSASVAIVKRNPKTGALGNQIANLRVGPTGVAGTNTGLSSVVWAE